MKNRFLLYANNKDEDQHVHSLRLITSLLFAVLNGQQFNMVRQKFHDSS